MDDEIYKEEIANGYDKMGENTKIIDPSERDHIDFIKDSIVEILTYLNQTEIIEDIEPLQLLNEYARTDNDDVIKLLETNNFLPILMNHIINTRDYNILEHLLECFCALSLRFPNYMTDDYFEPLIFIFDTILKEEQIDHFVLIQLIAAISIYLTTDIINNNIQPSFYNDLIALLPHSDALFNAITAFSLCFVDCADHLDPGGSSTTLVFSILSDIENHVDSYEQAAKIFKILIQKKFISMKIPQFKEILLKFLSFKNTNVAKIIFDAMSKMDENELNYFDDQLFVDISMEILTLESQDKSYDTMKASLFSFLQRLMQLYPFIFQKLFLDNKDTPFLNILVDYISEGTTIVKNNASFLLARILKTFPKYFTNAFVDQDEKIVNAVLGMLNLENSTTILIIEGLLEIGKSNPDAIFSMGEVGIIDAIEELLPSLEDDVGEMAQMFIDFAHEIYDQK